jgi:hypothetical protein
LFQVDLMNLFEANRILSVKLNQSFDSLYSLPFYEYSMYKKILVKELDESDSSTSSIVQERFEIERDRPRTGPPGGTD